MGQETDIVSYFRALEERPFEFDFYQALRRIECLFPDKPRIGQALRPADEPVRFGQEPSLAFAPAVLSGFEPATDVRPPRLEVSFFGLLGPNGPLPLHLTEFARERLLHEGDASFARFLDVLNHRYLELFYRAWAQAQPTVNLDRKAQDRFAVYVGAMFGLAGEHMRERDAVADFAKFYYSGFLAAQVRNGEYLATLLSDYFGVQVRVDEFVGQWLILPSRERSRLGDRKENTVLGKGTVLGGRVWDRQSKIRLRLGPLNLEQYEDFLPGSVALHRLVSWMRQYLCFELDWDVRLSLQHEHIPQLVLGRYGRLGWTSWLGTLRGNADAADLTLDVERYVVEGRKTIH